MIRKSTRVVFTVFIIILTVGFILNRNLEREKTTRTPPPLAAERAIPEKALANLLEISYSKYDEVVLNIIKQKDGSWSFTSDQKQKINQARVTEIISNLESLVVLSKMKSVSTAEDLGLLPSSQEIALIDAQEKTYRIAIGDLTPTGSGYYLQVDRDDPVIVGKGGLETIMNLLTAENLVLET